MLGLLLIYWIGKNYYQLAEKHDKSKWGYAILGIVAYYGASILVVALILIGVELFSTQYTIDSIPERALDFIGLPFGALGCWGLYQLLKKRWGSPKRTSSAEVLDNFDQI